MATRRERLARWPGCYGGALVATAWLVPVVAGVIAVTAHLLPSSGVPEWLSVNPPLVGLMLAVGAWLLLSLFYAPFATASASNPGSYGDLSDRLSQLDARLENSAWCAVGDIREACVEARARRDLIKESLKAGGVGWVLASGYITAWKQLH